MNFIHHYNLNYKSLIVRTKILMCEEVVQRLGGASKACAGT